MRIILNRLSHTTHGTFGVLMDDTAVPFAITMERPWLNNQKSISCIPDGVYTAKRCRHSEEYNFKDSPKFGDTFVVENVPNRSHILFHTGNLDDDSHGCILVGEQFGVLGNNPAILASKAGFKEFFRLTSNVHEFQLVINRPVLSLATQRHEATGN